MYRRRSKRTQRLLFFLTYTFVPLLIIGLVVVLVLLIQGYRFNAFNNTVYQAGLVQFGTTPNGATVTVDGAKLGSKTRTRINVTSGQRTIAMTRDGYVPWQKTVSVQPGSVLWLTYARLIPQEVSVEDLYSYKTVAKTLVNAKSNLYGIQPSASSPTLVTIPATSGDPTRQSATIPASLYTKASKQSFSAMDWGESGRYVLFRYDAGAKHDWLLLDRNSPENSVNISQQSKLVINSAFFDRSDDRYVYLRSGGALRRFDRSNNSVSAVLANNVIGVTQSSDGVVMVVSGSGGKTSLSYVTHAANTARAINFSNTSTIRAASVVVYDRRDYVSVLDGTHVYIAQTDLGSSNDAQPLQLTSTISLSAPKTASGFEPVPGGRFVVIRDGKNLSTYDLELAKLSQITMQSSTSPLNWVDDYHLLDLDGDQLSILEFDGANRTPVTNAAGNYAAVFSVDNQYMYLLQKGDGVYNVVRAQMIL